MGVLFHGKMKSVATPSPQDAEDEEYTHEINCTFSVCFLAAGTYEVAACCWPHRSSDTNHSLGKQTQKSVCLEKATNDKIKDVIWGHQTIIFRVDA